MAHFMDLRLRAVGLLETGLTVAQISARLDIGTARLWRWKARAKQGRLAPMYPPRSAYKLDEPAMRVYLGAFIWLNILMLCQTGCRYSGKSRYSKRPRNYPLNFSQYYCRLKTYP